MRAHGTWRKRSAAVLAVVALAGLVALWWTVPVEVTVNVQVPAGVRSDTLSIVLARETSGPLVIQAEHELHFGDKNAQSTSFTVRLPRGKYRLLVACDNTDRFDEQVHVLGGRTVTVALRQHEGHDGRVLLLE